MEVKREEEWKAATRETEGNVKEYWGNHRNGVIGIWRGRGEWGKRIWKRRKKKKGGVETQSKEEQLTVNLNEAKIMNENWIETTKMRKNLKKPMNKFVVHLDVLSLRPQTNTTSASRRCAARYSPLARLVSGLRPSRWGPSGWTTNLWNRKKDRRVGNAGDFRRGMKSGNKRKGGKRERVKRKFRKKSENNLISRN